MGTFDQGTFSLLKGMLPTKHSRKKAFRDKESGIRAYLGRPDPDDQPKKQPPKEGQSKTNQQRRMRHIRQRAKKHQ